jgi:glycerol-3-phosphate dehydrogenase
MARIVGGARRLEDLGRNFGSDLTLAEVRYLVAVEWARSAEDILWRRTRLGLAITGSAVDELQDAVAQLLR